MRMLYLSIIVLAGHSDPVAQQPAPTLTKAPFTYILDYGADHIRSADYIQRISQAPPTLLHLGKDVPFTHNWGPIQALGGENQAFGKRKPYAKEDDIRRLSPAETHERIADLTQLASDLHRAGARWVTPYICSMTIGGHPQRRAGFWEFYDAWDEYQAFGLGPRPAADPLQWLQVDANGKPVFFYSFQSDFYPPYEPNIRFAACQNHPEWRMWTERVVENIARCGFDGVFVDNAGSLRCWCAICREKWRTWLDGRYSTAEREALFGAADPEMGEPRQPGLLWAETQRFRCACLQEHLRAIADAGQRITGKRFLVFPNGGEKRPEHIVHIYADADWIMYERSLGPNGTHPGMVLRPIVEDLALKKYNDNIFEYKYVQCLRRNVRPILLTRPGYNLPKAERALLEMTVASAALGNAEAAAFGGGGGFLQRADPGLMQVQRQYRQFFERHATLYEGLDSLADVAIVMLPDLAWLKGTTEHQLEARKATQSLLDAHVLFDYVIADQVTLENLSKYAAVLLPRVSHLTDDQARALCRYVESGGILVMTGAGPEFDDRGRPLASPLAELFAISPGESEAVRQLGKGAVHAVARPSQWLETDVGRAFSTIVGPGASALAKVRVNAFRQPDAVRYVIHLVNYNVPLGITGGDPETQRDIELALALPGIATAARLRCYDPQGGTTEAPAEIKDGKVRFKVAELSIYCVIEVTGS